MRKILVTGGCGFIGSNFVRLALARLPECRPDQPRQAHLRRQPGEPRRPGGRPALPLRPGRHLPTRHWWSESSPRSSIDTVVHFAAESHVDRSIDGPRRVHPHQHRRHLHAAGGRPKSVGLQGRGRGTRDEASLKTHAVTASTRFLPRLHRRSLRLPGRDRLFHRDDPLRPALPLLGEQGLLGPSGRAPTFTPTGCRP